MSGFEILIISFVMLIFLIPVVRGYLKGSKPRWLGGEGLVIPDPIPPGGIPVPATEVFSSLRGAGRFRLSESNFTPLLKLHETGIEYRVIFKKRMAYSRIEQVDTLPGLLPKIILTFFDRQLTFGLEMLSREDQRELLQFFDSRGVPLTDRAADLLFR